MTTKTAAKAAKPTRTRAPKFGEVVHYVRGGRLLPALVTGIHEDGLSLVAFDHMEARTHYPARVPRGHKADGDYWFFPGELETNNV